MEGDGALRLGALSGGCSLASGIRDSGVRGGEGGGGDGVNSLRGLLLGMLRLVAGGVCGAGGGE